MSDIHITIYGGNVQILPNATETVQNFYGDPFGERTPTEEPRTEEPPPEADKLLLYVNEENLGRYLSMIATCQSATELGKVIVEMQENEPRLTKEEIVRERFIRLLLPFATQVTKGLTIDNLRARVNDALAKRPRRRT